MCHSAVLDEVDILFNDEEFEQALQSFINSSPVTTQYLFVTATLPVDIYNKLVEVFPDSEVIMGPGMHRTSTGLEEVGIALYSIQKDLPWDITNCDESFCIACDDLGCKLICHMVALTF